MADHPETLRRRSLAAAPGSPWVTYYDAATGGRVELSGATLDNWVAKAAGLLAEEYDIDTESTVVIDLPHHWLLHVWTWATWALGAAVGLPEMADHADVVIISPGAKGIGTLPPGVPALVCPEDPMARPLGARTPPGTIDVMADIATYPDFFPLPMPSGELTAVRARSATLSGAEAVEQARALVPAHGSQLLVTSSPGTVAALLAATLSAATLSARTILASPDLADAQRDEIVRQEQVDITVGNL